MDELASQYTLVLLRAVTILLVVVLPLALAMGSFDVYRGFGPGDRRTGGRTRTWRLR